MANNFIVISILITNSSFTKVFNITDSVFNCTKGGIM